MHIDNYNPSIPMYYDHLQQQPYEYPNNNTPGQQTSDNFEGRYNWREVSEAKAIMMSMGNSMPNMPNMSNMPNMPNLPNMPSMPIYDSRSSQHHHEMFAAQPKPNESYLGPQPPQFQPQINVVQRISGIVKSQLSFLQSAMHFVEIKSK